MISSSHKRKAKTDVTCVYQLVRSNTLKVLI